MFKHWENVEKIEPMLRGKNKEALEQVRKETSRTTLFPSWPSFLFADEQNMKHVAPQSAIYGEAGRRLRPKLSRQKWNVQQWLARWTNLHNKNEWQSPDVKWKAIGTRDSPVLQHLIASSRLAKQRNQKTGNDVAWISIRERRICLEAGCEEYRWKIHRSTSDESRNQWKRRQ